MNGDRVSAAMDQYLAQLELELKALPPAERREIVLEARSHVLERSIRSPSLGVPGVLAELGSPSQYARQFLPDTGDTTSDRYLAILTQLGGRPWIAVSVAAAVALMYGIALLTAGVATAKLLNPGGVGLWIHEIDGARRFMFRVGSSSAGPPGEVLGWWLVVIGYGVAGLIHLSVMAALRRLGRAQHRR